LADFKDERVYNTNTLTKVFLWSSLALLVCVIAMAWFDYSRPWKSYQIKFMHMERQKALANRNEAKGEIDISQYKKLLSDKKEAENDLKSRQNILDHLQNQQADLDNQIYKVNMVYQVTKAKIDATKYDYSEHYLKEGKDNPDLKKSIDQLVDQATDLNQKLLDLKQSRADTDKQMADLTAQRDNVKAKITILRKQFDFYQTRVASLKQDFFFDFRNAMLLDFMSPTIQIHQIVLNNLPEDMYFAKSMRVDRCTTCHQSIDKKGYEDAPEPFRTHPHLELYLGATSPHPIEKVGCTICHGGVGAAVNFNTCAHAPNDEEQAKKWKTQYGWKEPEGVAEPMLPLKYTEGSCLKCHGTQQHVNFAPHLDKGRELMVVRGCVGCHKVKNMEGLPKAGPNLLKVKGKLKKEFVLKWVWSPRSYNPAAKMPSYFRQTNNSDDEGLAKTKAELNSIVTYLFDHSGDYTPNEAPGRGSVQTGKKLFHDVGCAACHGMDDITGYHAVFAPDLSSVGSKLSPSWVYTWIRNPRHYDPETRMPQLRLSGQEASDITAYLMTKKNKDFEVLDPPQADPTVRDSLLVDYLKVQSGPKAAQAQVAGMTDEEKELLLGQKSLVKYGCFACHMITGFETAQGIGTELSEWGSKQISQIDFGFTDVAHTHQDFINTKLSNPRQFDKDKVQAFQDRLKMPNFNLSDEDRDAIITAVLGLTKTYVPDEMTAGIHGNGPLLEKGRRVISKFNCRGCHLIEDQGGKIRAMYENEGIDLSLAPPNLRKEGAKLQIDWFHNFLLGVHPIRPWLHIRMPSFHWTDEDVSDVITYFNAKEDQVFPFKAPETQVLKGQDLIQAKALFAKLQCQKCHVLGSKIPPDLNSAAPDLYQVHERLKPDWVVEWLKNPDDLMPGTRMPGFWPQDVSPAPRYFGGNSLKQREALRDYLFMFWKNEN
jgi:mono/diheme cytochrome c family protein/peptidoglycan hydrolase CwlO-like protein